MINFVAKFPNSLDKINAPLDVGVMNTWVVTRSPKSLIAGKRPWILDNGCFTSYNPDKILWALNRYAHVPLCVFAVLPDVVFDHKTTRDLFDVWYDKFKYFGYKTAYVLQDGFTDEEVPWKYIDAVFVGGSTDFKFSPEVAECVVEARSRKKWVHFGG